MKRSHSQMDSPPRSSCRGPGLIDFDNAVVFLVTHEALPNDPLTGTLPFMSAELLKESPYYADEDAPEPPVHSFKHDLESFLWVLVWVCLTREGPGERRHDLMSVEQTQPLLRLRKLVIGLFEDVRQAPGLTKTHLIHVAPRRTLVNAELLNYISVIFAPLKDLIFEFLSLISTAYEENRTDAHAVYDDVLRLFDKHISNSQRGPIRAIQETSRGRGGTEGR